ncbi:hypothetical protein AM493_05895 [Flavobacterium akiainvivens]|uniref:HTH lacI-type domain-containing protein n=1 Tax=Flavobacterium akiainvivens TaxID=1202724 RepID=A0A0M8MHC5_9FLAO|nr:LacI family DNA-binding transcriptional regulator [Flavobacterium akiainvivens]KOS05618.1 hypothetical protein AM493_05895 [Flavobacterium akiainvivens]SFQ35471.1 transcriptional regulator, LacI family [Flavobacterium akiainvivens]
MSKKKDKISIKDIAAAAGTSTTTVSFILNGKADHKVSPALIEKVLKIIEEKNYRPSSLAQSLRTGKTNTIALLVEDISNPFFSGIARLIGERAAREGYQIVYSSTENDPKKTATLLDFFTEKQVDGFIISPPAGALNDIQALRKNKPVVLFDRYFPQASMSHVVVDNQMSAFHGVRHMINNKFKNVGCVTLHSDQTQMTGRLQGYNEAMEQSGLKKYTLSVDYKADEHDRIVLEIAKFYKENPGMDALFFTTNYLAILGLEAMQRSNLKVGKDFAVMCFDEHDLFRLYSPPITVISQPLAEIAENAFNVLINEMETHSSAIKRVEMIEIPATLVIRQSTSNFSNFSITGSVF